MTAQRQVTNVNDTSANTRAFALDVLSGLTHSPKRLPPKYFYDRRGSELFSRITTLPEYYPAACEIEILKAHAPDIVAQLRHHVRRIVEFGSGDGTKTGILLNEFSERHVPFEYLTIDVSADAIEQVLERCRRDPAHTIPASGLVADYFGAMQYLVQERPVPTLALFLGSNIGNFTREEMGSFLLGIWEALNDGDYLLVGFDLRKDIATLERAYNDSEGVTAAFNFNVLARINRELGGNFDTDKFTHKGHYNPAEAAMESWLYATEEQDVYIGSLKKSFHFEPWEGLQTEYSYKFTIPAIDRLAARHGFVPETVFVDRHGYFADALWRVEKCGHSNGRGARRYG